MAFWVRRTQISDFNIADLGDKLVTGNNGEVDLHDGIFYEEIQASTSLYNAFVSGDLIRIDGPGGSVIPTGHEFDDAVATHEHAQFVMLDGTRSMTGNFNVGTNNITNVGTVDGVTVSAHASRHNPGGLDAIATATPGAVSAGATAAEGSATSFARSDHAHSVATGSPSAVGTANSAGTSGSVPRLDHVHDHGSQSTATHHAVATVVSAGFMDSTDKSKLNGVASGATNTPLTNTAPVDVTKAAAVVGTASEAARQDHKHDVSTGTPGTTTFGSAAEGTATSLARSDHAHALATPSAPADVTKAAANAGTSANVARQDHKHDISTGTPGTVTFGSAAEGTATSLARSDHTHALTAPGAPANVTKAAASAGTSVNVAREDHKHDITTAAPAAGAVAIGNTAAEGTATSVARSDHQHTVSGGSPVSVGTGNSDGTATTFSRSDHVHSGLTRGTNDFTAFTSKASPVGADVLLIEDSAASYAKKSLLISNLPGGVDTTAIHKATAAEISAMTEKTTPVAADLLVIEDSAASYAKKKMQLGSMPTSTVGFGANYQTVVDVTRTTTTSSTPQDKVTLTTPALTGTYRVGWVVVVDVGTKSKLVGVRLYNATDAVTIGVDRVASPGDTAVRDAETGFAEVVFTGAAKSIKIQYWSPDNTTTVGVQGARIEIWKVA